MLNARDPDVRIVDHMPSGFPSELRRLVQPGVALLFDEGCAVGGRLSTCRNTSALVL
jgi:hypothetical protein